MPQETQFLKHGFRYKYSIKTFQKRLDDLPHTIKIYPWLYKFDTGEQITFRDNGIFIKGLSAIVDFKIILADYLNNAKKREPLVDYLVYYSYIKSQLKNYDYWGSRNKKKPKEVPLLEPEEEELYE